MADYPWRALLEQWSAAVLDSPDYAASLPPEVKESGWLGFAPASPAAMAAAEARLGRALPPSYRQFLEVSNGWRLVGIPSVTRLLPIEETEWMARRHPEWIDAWMAGAGGFEEAGGDEAYQPEDLRGALVISDGEDAIFLLNPRVVSAAGESEAWLFDVEAGIDGYASFWELMQAEYEALRDLMATAAARLGPAPTAEEAAAGLAALAAELGRLAEQYEKIARRNLAMPGYEQAIARGLREARRQVVSLEEQALSSVQVRQRLVRLAGEMEEAWQRGVRPAHGGSLSAQLQSRGMAEGYRQATGVIRAYLKDPFTST